MQLFCQASFDRVFVNNEVLDDETESTDWGRSDLLLVAGGQLSVFEADGDEGLKIADGWGLLGVELAGDDVFDGIEVADEAQGPRVSDLDVDIGVLKNLRREAMIKNCIADELTFGIFIFSFLVLDEIAKCLDDSCLEDWWNCNFWVILLDVEYAWEEIKEFLGLLFSGENFLVLVLVHDADKV